METHFFRIFGVEKIDRIIFPSTKKCQVPNCHFRLGILYEKHAFHAGDHDVSNGDDDYKD